MSDIAPNVADTGEPDDDITEAKELFKLCQDNEDQNRKDALDDLKFARLDEQWPDTIRTKREKEGRPCLTVNQLPAFIRQVVNECRQNKPAIKVHPADSQADAETAEIINGLIRNIEVTSHADVAFDTAVDFAVTMGFGYFRINTYYAHDDTFDLDLRIDRVSNPFSVWGDPYSTAADSSDWNVAFVTDDIPKSVFEKKYGGAKGVDWDAYDRLTDPWRNEETVKVAEWWTREDAPRTILLLSNQQVIGEDAYAEQKDLYDALGVSVIGEREVRSHKVRQRIITGAEVLEERAWPGRYIPIVPVYGEEVNVEGKRHFRSLIRSAKDTQRMVNYWRTTSTEMVALAPRVPFIGAKGAFATDAAKWASANTDSWPYLEYDNVAGAPPPQRQPLDVGPAAGAMQEAMTALTDMQRIMGIYNAGLGQQSNEVSGIAINARKVEGDVSNFHFMDNETRAISHGGEILVDLIPEVYNSARIIRTLGPDMKQSQPINIGPRTLPNGTVAPITQPAPGAMPGPDGYQPQDIVKVFDLTLGRYGVTVETGPGFATKRQEAASQMIQFIQAYPAAAPVIGDLIAQNLDWPGADVISQRLHAILPAAAQGPNPAILELQQTLKQVEAQGLQAINQLKQELAAAKAANDLKQRELEIDAYQAETDRLKALYPKGMQPDPVTQPLMDQTVMAAENPQDLYGTVAGGFVPPTPQMPAGGAPMGVPGPTVGMGTLPHPPQGPALNGPTPPQPPQPAFPAS